MSIHRKALSHLRRADPVLGRIIDEVGPCPLRPKTDGSHFEFIARSIIFQQLSTKAATTIHDRVVALCGGSMSTEALSSVSDDAIRGAGVSRQKLAYLRDLCARAADGTIDESRLPGLPDEDVIQHLVQVKGVGVWTAQMFLVFRLVRPDVLPVLDLGIRKGVQRAYGLRKLPDAKRVEKIAAPWAPYRTIGSWYMWRVLELETYQAPKKGKAA